MIAFVDPPSLQQDQEGRAHQGVQHDLLAPLDHPLPWVQELPTLPINPFNALLLN